MARYAFVTWDGGGNTPPAVGIAQELKRRGHEVLFLGYEAQRKRFETQGFSFVTLRRSGSFDIYEAHDPAARIAGLMAHVWACPEHLDDIPDAIADVTADVLIVDCMMQGALAGVSRLSIPIVVLAHSSIGGLIPPPESPMGAARLAATNNLRSQADLPGLTRLTEAWIELPTLVTTIPDLDPTAAEANARVRYVGPIFEQFSNMNWNASWETGDDRPLVLVSFTTTRLWDQRGRIRNTLDGLRNEPVRVLVTAADPGEVGVLPANAAIRAFVPHGVVLSAAALTITHAGHGTVTASLAFGVPLVTLANPAADQPFLAATLQRLGAAIALDGESEASAIRAAVREVLHQHSYADAARTLAAAIHAAPGVTGAAVELERLRGGSKTLS